MDSILLISSSKIILFIKYKYLPSSMSKFLKYLLIILESSELIYLKFKIKIQSYYPRIKFNEVISLKFSVFKVLTSYKLLRFKIFSIYYKLGI